ncbi:MAG: hypothetical protein V4683_01200 [Bacteroidota bacterium]
MNLKKITSKVFLALFITALGFKSIAQQPGSFMIPDLDGYKRAYKMNYGGAQGYKEFFKTYKDSYLDTVYYVANSIKTLDNTRSGWRLTDAVGIAFPYCGKLSASGGGNANPDENMFLKAGGYNNLELDRLFGKKGNFGLGLLGGYAFYGVDQTAYKAKYNSYWYPATNTSASSATLLKSKPYEVFYLLAGPVATFGLGKKLTLDLTAKVGAANNDVAYVGANNSITGEILHRTQPNHKRWAIGGNAGLRLMYKIAENWGLGLNVNAFNSNTEYEVLDQARNNSGEIFETFERRQSNFNFGVAIQRMWPTDKKPVYVPLNKLDPPIPALVAFTPSISSPSDQTFASSAFSNEFSWISNDNSADKANEMFTFKLYRVSGKEPILVKTQKENSLKLDSPLPVPADVCTTDDYYYTVHSTKGTSFSEIATASFKIKSDAAAKCGDTTNMINKDEAGAKAVYLTRILGNESYTRQIVKYDEGKGCKCPIDTLTKSGSRLVEYFKQYSANRELSAWPDGLPIPRKASGFIYEVRQIFDGENGEQKPGPAERYKLEVDRKTRAVTIVPITAKKRR